jgi:hypothetical protein
MISTKTFYHQLKKSVLRIWIRMNPHLLAGSGPRIFLEADPDPDPWLQNWHSQYLTFLVLKVL